MPNPLLDLLSGIGNVLDTPGSVVRGLLSGDADRAFGGILDPSRRVSGRDMLDKWGVTNNDSGTLGDIGGFAAQVATDPLTWLGGTLARTILGRSGRASEAAGAISAPKPIGSSSTLLDAAPGVGGYKRLADGTIIRTEPLAAESTLGIGASGEKTFAAGSKPLTEAEQWGGVRPTELPASLPENPELSNSLMKLRRQYTKADFSLTPENIPHLKLTGGLDAFEPGQTAAERLAQVKKGFFNNKMDFETDISKAAYDEPTRTMLVPEGSSRERLRHESFHALTDMARRSGDSSALGLVGRAANRLQESQNPLLHTLGFIGEEMGATGAEKVGKLAQIQKMAEFLRSPNAGYLDQFSGMNPLAGAIYGSAAIPRVALGAGGAGAAALLSALGAGSQ